MFSLEILLLKWIRFGLFEVKNLFDLYLCTKIRDFSTAGPLCLDNLVFYHLLFSKTGFCSQDFHPIVHHQALCVRAQTNSSKVHSRVHHGYGL